MRRVCRRINHFHLIIPISSFAISVVVAKISVSWENIRKKHKYAFFFFINTEEFVDLLFQWFWKAARSLTSRSTERIKSLNTFLSFLYFPWGADFFFATSRCEDATKYWQCKFRAWRPEGCIEAAPVASNANVSKRCVYNLAFFARLWQAIWKIAFKNRFNY